MKVGSWDTQLLCTVMWNAWNDVLAKTLGKTERSLLAEVREIRNNWAHQRSGSGDDAYRALDTTERLLGAVSAPQVAELAKVKGDLLRQKWGEQARRRARRAGAEATARVEGEPAGGLPPWGEVITPHPDVGTGNFVQGAFGLSGTRLRIRSIDLDQDWLRIHHDLLDPVRTA